MFEPDKTFLKQGFLDATLDVKKSRFIASLSHVSNRQEAMIQVVEARKRYPDARHHCWAYVIENGSSAAMSDDGEPSGTAGKPILSVIQHKSISDIVVVISRYFGGIKLGAGGLVRAYSSATQNVIDQVPMIEPVVQADCVISCDFSQEQACRYWLESLEGLVLSSGYTEKVSMKTRLPKRNLATLVNKLEALGAGYQV